MSPWKPVACRWHLGWRSDSTVSSTVGRLSPAWAIMLLALLGVACVGAERHEPARPPRAAPPELRVQEASTYEVGVAEQAELDQGLDEICAVDPEACPKLDFSKDATHNRPSSGSVADAAAERSTLLSQSSAKAVSVESASAEQGPEILLTGPLAGAPAVSGGGGGRAIAKPVAKPPPQTKTKERANAVVMRDVEARLHVEVDDIERATKKVRAMVESVGGQVVNDVVEDSATNYGAAISVRIPTGSTHEFLDQVGALGKLRSRKVVTQDIGRRYFDAQILLRNLNKTLARYEALLEQAQDVKDMAIVEANLARVRTRIERVEGDLRWMADREARSTVYVTLSTTLANQGPVPAQAKLWPGARAVLPIDLANREVFIGGGASLLGSRGFSIDVDIARSRDAEASERDWFALGTGGDLYSDLLGGGRRAFLNPYLGFRVGYLHARGNHEFSGAAVLGVELYRSRFVLVDSHLQTLALFGAEGLGLHAAVQPMLGVYFAF